MKQPIKWVQETRTPKVSFEVWVNITILYNLQNFYMGNHEIWQNIPSVGNGMFNRL